MISSISRAISLSFLLCIAAPLAAQADPDFEYNADGMSLRGAIGRTMVGVTRDSSAVWSLFLHNNGKAKFNFSSGKSQTATYRRLDSYILCFKGLIEKDLNAEICKRAETLGRGLDWMTIDLKTVNGKTTWGKTTTGETVGSSQMVYSFDGDVDVDRNSYVSDVNKWAGHLIVGRTLKDKEAWSAMLGLDGRLDFVFGSGKRYSGTYTLSKSEICLTFPSNPGTSGCRKPTVENGKVLWTSSKYGGATSELVFMKKVDVEGPRRIFSSPSKNYSFYSASPDGKKLAATSTRNNQLHLVNSVTKGTYGVVKVPHPYDVEFSQDSSLLGMVQNGGIEIFDAHTGRFLKAIETARGAPNANEILFLKNSNELLIGDAAGGLRVISWKTGATLRESVFDTAGIANMALNSDGLIGLGSRNGKLAVIDSALVPVPGLEAQSQDTFGGMTFTKDGMHFLAAGKDDKLYMLNLSPTATLKSTSVKMPTSKLWSVEVSPVKNQVVVGLGDALGFVSLPELTLVDTWKAVSESNIERATYLPDGAGVTFVNSDHELDTWAGSSAEAQLLKQQATQRDGAAKQLFESQKLTFKTGNAAALSEYEPVLAEAKMLFETGQCAEYEARRDGLRLMNRRADCASAAQRRAKVAEFDAALAAQDCTLAQSIADSISLATQKPAECQKAKDDARDKADYAAAKAAGECELVRGLSSKFGEPEAGDDCTLSVALAGDNPRVMYLAGIKLDTSGDHARAKQLYLEVMTRFPNDDLAIDAANRLTALADLEKTEKAQAQTAAETAAAIKAAERRAADAERAARKASDDAERQRKALEAESRRADQARRDAQAAQQRAQADANARARAQQPRRDPACDRVYLGMEFNGGMFGVFRYRVQGLNPVTGRVTIRERTNGTTQEIRCSQVP